MVENGECFDEFPDLKDFAHAVRVDKDQKVFALVAPDMDYIAVMERKVLDETIAEYKDVPSDELSKISHEDTAYKKVCQLMKTDPERDTITRLDIARAGGASDEMIEYIREEQIIERTLAS